MSRIVQTVVDEYGIAARNLIFILIADVDYFSLPPAQELRGFY